MSGLVFAILISSAAGQAPTFVINNQPGIGDITQFQVGSNNKVRIDPNGNIIVTGGVTSGTNGGTGGILTLNGATSGSASVTVSSTGTLALPSGTTATNMVLTTPNLGTPSAANLASAIGLPLGSGVMATFLSPLSLSLNTLSCPTCVTSASSLASNAIMTGAGSQNSQTPSASATLNSSGSMSLPGTITSGSNGGTGGSLTLNASGSGNVSITASSTGSNLQLNNASTFVDTNGSLTVGRHLNQNAANTFAGSCSMSGGTTCTFSITASFTSPLTFVSQDGSATVAQIAAKCSLSGTTVTITAFSNNSLKWDCLIVGNPN